MDTKEIFTRITLGGLAILGLTLVFIFQHADPLYILSESSFKPELRFIVNRTARIFLNDTFMLLLLYTLFLDKNIIKLALIIQGIDLLILFPLYLIFKLPAEGASEISSPLLAQFHRLIVNPTLMILLIPAIYYQKFVKRNPV
jgi:exosortase F-associated protein